MIHRKPTPPDDPRPSHGRRTEFHQNDFIADGKGERTLVFGRHVKDVRNLVSNLVKFPHLRRLRKNHGTFVAAGRFGEHPRPPNGRLPHSREELLNAFSEPLAYKE